MKFAKDHKYRSGAEKLNEALFAAFFTDNLNLADENVLLEIGAEAGLDEKAMRNMLQSDEYARQTRENECEAAAMGVTAVPFFKFENGATASGALSPEEFKKILKEAARSAQGAGCGPQGCAAKQDAREARRTAQGAPKN